MFGLLNINKPPGPTSHDVVDQVRRVVGRGVKVGHAGTLDPFAGGVLVVCLGQATRLAQYVQQQCKRYTARVRLGAVSDTDDPEGTITESPPAAPPERRLLEQVLEGFVGTIDQIPPAHSAVHVNGQRAYKAARAGQQVILPPRQVDIHSIRLVEYNSPDVVIDVRCSSGTYIRALARDVGQALGVGAYCIGLTRTAIGPFTIEQAVDVRQLDTTRHLLPAVIALHDMPKVKLDHEHVQRLANGRPVTVAGPIPAAEAAVVDDQGELVALTAVLKDSVTLQPLKVFGADRRA